MSYFKYSGSVLPQEAVYGTGRTRIEIYRRTAFFGEFNEPRYEYHSEEAFRATQLTLRSEEQTQLQALYGLHTFIFLTRSKLVRTLGKEDLLKCEGKEYRLLYFENVRAQNDLFRLVVTGQAK